MAKVTARSDRSGKRAPRPAVAVDAALLTVTPGDDGSPELAVLQVRRVGAPGWCLPGTLLRPRERLVDAVLRCLREQAGVAGLRPRQLHVLDDPDRGGRDWVLSVAHVDAGPQERLAGRFATTRVVPTDAFGRLPSGHGEIIARAVDYLRRRYLAAPDPNGFLPDTFTLRELRAVHEAVAGEELQRDTFRRTMDPLLAATGEVVVGGRGRPAELFRRA